MGPIDGAFGVRGVCTYPHLAKYAEERPKRKVVRFCGSNGSIDSNKKG